MSNTRPFYFLLAAFTSAIYVSPVIAADEESVSPEVAAEIAEQHMPENRAVPSMHQDDHIHTRPDVPVAIFDGLDVDDDEHLQWSEVQPLEMTREEFRSVDANGSGELDIEEYVAISPNPDNDYVIQKNGSASD